ncbi:hypothetical protein HPB47_005804 [Ixodes persulcatus]|uniref:Uncharacterized protein n=1 Tax=Ixodes persulcatus TaxID=34615 RepID=A0AC60PCM4_IXOPE|nr:hypothetical protein HPB47_005804 [Ixodes persulcatus]
MPPVGVTFGRIVCLFSVVQREEKEDYLAQPIGSYARTGLCSRWAMLTLVCSHFAVIHWAIIIGSRWLLGLPERSGKIRDLSRFDAQFFAVHPKQAHVMDPQLRLFLETSYEAIVDAGYDPGTLRGRNIGVFVGCGESESYEAFNVDTDKIDGYALIGCCRAMFSNRVSHCLDFNGPSVTVDTGCSSAMTALNQAMLALRSGQCEAALVGGSTLTLNPATTLNLYRFGMLSPDGKCKAFDADAKGYVRSETVGVFFLQRVSEARRIYAKLVHAKANADGFKAEGISYPSSRAQEALLRDVYEEARVDPRSVSYVEAHCPGTKVGDPQELSAISSVFCGEGRKEPLLIGSVKSNVGHSEAASASVDCQAGERPATERASVTSTTAAVTPPRSRPARA